MKYQTLALGCMVVLTLYLTADFEVTWLSGVGIKDIYYYNKRDLFFVGFFILPAMTSHLITIWAHYYRADAIFQESIIRVSTATARERKRISIWERHDSWTGFTFKYWVLVVISVLLNTLWFAQPLVAYLPTGIRFLGLFGGITAYVAFGSGYAAMGSCGMLLLLVLRRSMLQALGFTYADLLPLHRWMGVAFIFWSTVHTVCYILYYIHFDSFWDEFNLDGETRGPQNMIALVAYASLLGLGITAIPQVRRSCYLLFITAHRVFTVVTFVGTLMHFPYYMIWYYVLPSMCLYLADRFVPKFIQSCSIAPEVVCSYNKEADILTVVLISKNKLEPLKPYYPGDYVNLEIPELSLIYHPFTIASYWAEDPYTMTLYIRTFQENKTSWTRALARLCDESAEPVLVKANVDGVFGDRVHDYLSSKFMVIFAAAQIESSAKSMSSPVYIEVHLICTFRYESELYAYGDFMHRITHDPRFTSWLHTQIYVSRPDKYAAPAECPSGQCVCELLCCRIQGESHQEDGNDEESDSESTALLSSFKKSSKQRTVYGGCGDNDDMEGHYRISRPALCSSSSSMTIPNTTACAYNVKDATPNRIQGFAATMGEEQQVEDSAPSSESIYKTLPTFPAASSASSSTAHAKKDLIATTLILVVPMIMFLLSRNIPWEGTFQGRYRWCRTTRDMDQHMTNNCLWTYALLPGILHIAIAMTMGYIGLWVARGSSLFQSRTASSETIPRFGVRRNAETGAMDLGSHDDAAAAAANSFRNLVLGLSALGVVASHVNSRKGSISFKRGRIQVSQHIQELKALGIGQECDGNGNGEAIENKRAGAIVFGGGPDAFVNMIEESSKKARWAVEFHRETWAP
ncbi:ferric/cupric-chelate reductase [Mortierella sp. GBA30]|nr:ferric/cupric-chelate reductase [Mortierella sp. GBA30]